jgi:hypothetical protein
LPVEPAGVVEEEDPAAGDPEPEDLATENLATPFPVTWPGVLSCTKVYRGDPS